MKASSTVPDRASPRSEVGEEDGPHADDDGLLALQLRRAAGRQDRSVADLIPKIGPYDKWATMWGYKPIPGAKTPDDEKKTLDEWAREQDDEAVPALLDRRHRAARIRATRPKRSATATRWRRRRSGMKNLERVSRRCCCRRRRQGRASRTTISRKSTAGCSASGRLEMNHVAAIVGGFNSQQKHIGQEGVRFTPVPRATAGQRRAVPERQRVRRRRRGRSTRTSCGASSRSACSIASGPASSACSARS